VSHYENNYVGAVKRLNAIGTQLAELDFAKAPNFMINGLKREELIAANSMILHEIYFDGLGGGAGATRRAGGGHRATISVASNAGVRNLSQWARRKAAVRAGSSFPTPRETNASSINGAADHTTTRPAAAGAGARYVRARLSYGTMVQRPHAMSTSIWKQSAGTTPRSCTNNTAAKASGYSVRGRLARRCWFLHQTKGQNDGAGRSGSSFSIFVVSVGPWGE